MSSLDLQPTAEQREIIDEAFSRPLDDLLPLSRLHAANPGEPWRDLAALGLFGVAVDPAAGGVGLGVVEEALLAIALGRKLAGPDIMSTLMAVHLADDAQQSRIASGDLRAVPATSQDGTIWVTSATGGDALLVRLCGEAALGTPAMVSGKLALQPSHWSLPLAQCSIDQKTLVWADGDALLRLRLIEAAALAGIATCAVEMAVEYARIREQFGHAIGGFQAIKHHCANMAAAALAARDLVTFAAVALDARRADAALQVESALLIAMDGALSNARRNIQIHGGIGFSAEAAPHLVLKRAHLAIEAAGGADPATDRVAAAGSAFSSWQSSAARIRHRAIS